MMKFLLDQGLPRSTVQDLITRGIAAEHVADQGMSRASDADILRAAQLSDSVVVTLDADFHSLLAAAGAQSPSVIRIRIEGLTARQVADIVEHTSIVAAPELALGAAISVTESGIRIRALPLV